MSRAEIKKTKRRFEPFRYYLDLQKVTQIIERYCEIDRYEAGIIDHDGYKYCAFEFLDREIGLDVLEKAVFMRKEHTAPYPPNEKRDEVFDEIRKDILTEIERKTRKKAMAVKLEDGWIVML